MTFTTISEVRAANKAAGYHWFDRSSMRFFNTVIESKLYAGKYFITSDRMRVEDPKRYSIRAVREDGGVDTVGSFQDFCKYLTIEDARAAVRRLL